MAPKGNTDTMPGARGTGIGGQLHEQAAGCAEMGEGHQEPAGHQPLPRSLGVKPVCLFSPCPWSIAPCMQLESTVCFETKIKVGSLHCRGSPALLSPTPCALCLPCELGVQGVSGQVGLLGEALKDHS